MRNWPSDSPCKDDKAGFTMGPLKALSDRVGIRNECLRSLKKIIFNCFFFFTKWRWTSPGDCWMYSLDFPYRVLFQILFLFIYELKYPALPVAFKKSNFEKKNYFEFLYPMLPFGYPWVSSKNVSQNGPAVWPTIANILSRKQTSLKIGANPWNAAPPCLRM